MNLSTSRYLLSIVISIFGLLVPILPRFYMIYLRTSNPERVKDAFILLRDPSLYFAIVFPFIALSSIAWSGLSRKDLSETSVFRRVSGLVIVVMILFLIFNNLIQPAFFMGITYIVLAVIIWLVLIHQKFSEVVCIKRIGGVVVSFVAIGYWGLMVSMYGVWGLAAYNFLICAPFLMLLTYFSGGALVYWIMKRIFPNLTQSLLWIKIWK